MKTRRRLGARIAGFSLLLLVAPTTTTASPDAALVASAPTEREHLLTAQGGRAAVIQLTSAEPSPSPVAPPPPPEHALACPVDGPVEFIDSWGFRRSGARRHQGVDMLAAPGTPVVAIVAGTVSHRSNPVGGLSFHLQGDDGTYYYGTHLSGYGAAGWVPVGTVIGYVGDSGNARGTPHLHFEIHPGGEGTGAINPYALVALLCDETSSA